MVNSIYVTPHPNDDDLHTTLRKQYGSLISTLRPAGLFADIVTRGVWEDDVSVTVTGERKHLSDLINSIESGRLLRQFQDAGEAGAFRQFLFVEGEYRCGEGDVIEVRRKAVFGLDYKIRSEWGWFPLAVPVPNSNPRWKFLDFSYSRLDSFLSQLSTYAQITVKRSTTVQETAAQVYSMWAMFQKPPSSHSSLNQFYTDSPPVISLGGRPSIMRRLLKEFDGIDWGKSETIESEFPHMRRLLGLSDLQLELFEKRIQKVHGVGKVISHKMRMQLEGEKI